MRLICAEAAVVLCAGLVGCNTLLEPFTKGSDGVTYYGENGEKVSADYAKDHVMLKASSEAEAEALTKYPFFVRTQHLGDSYVIGKINPKEMTLKDLLRVPGVVEGIYGLKDGNGIKFPTTTIAAEFHAGYTREEALAKAGLTDRVIEVKPPQWGMTLYLIKLDVGLNEVISICNRLVESGLCSIAEPSFMRLMPRPDGIIMQ